MKTVPLGDATKIVRGVTFKPSDTSAVGVGVMRTKNVQRQLDLSDIVRVPAAVVRREEQYLREGDTLVSSANSWYAVGRACWIPKLPEPLAIGGFVTAIRPTSDDLDPRFFYRWFTSPRTQATLRSFSNKTTNISNLNLKLTAQLSVPVPPLGEQRRIVAILDQAEALRAKRRQILVHLDCLTQSIFQDMFGYLSETVPLSELVEEFRYGTSNKAGHSGSPTLRIPNVVNGTIDTREIKVVNVTTAELARLKLRDGDLLFVRTNGNPDNVGRCAVFTHDAVAAAGQQRSDWIFASYLIRARLNVSTHPAFLAAYLRTQTGRRHLKNRSKTSAGQYNINIEGIGSVPVPAVEYRRQSDFLDRNSRLEAQAKLVRSAAAADDELFASLQSRAFRGEL